MGSPPLAIWIGVFLVGLIVGRWWFAVGAGVIVFIVVSVTADTEADPIGVGFLVGVAILLTLLCATLLRSFAVGIVKDELARRRARR